MGHGDAFCHTLDRVFDQIPNFRKESTNGAAHDSFAGKRIKCSESSGIHKADGNDGTFQRINLSGNNCLHCQVHFGEGRNRIGTLMRTAAVCAGTNELNRKSIGCRLQVADFEADLTFL